MMISGRADYMDGGMNSAAELGMGGPMLNGRGAYRPPDRNRGICRDYHSELSLWSISPRITDHYSPQTMGIVLVEHFASTVTEMTL